MDIYTYPSGPYYTNAYVAACPETKRAAVVDPSSGSTDSIQACLERNHLVPDKIILTHSHWDHIADVASLKKLYNIPVLIHPLDAPNLEHPGADGIPLSITIEGVRPDVLLHDNDIFQVGNLRFQVIHTPGHSPGGICLYASKEGVLFSGDTIFQGSIGNISLPTSQPDLMWPTLDKLARLPPDTKVYPGHGRSTTIGKESWLPNAREIFGN